MVKKILLGIGIVLLIVAIGIFIVVKVNTKTITENLSGYVESIVNIELTDLVEFEKGKVEETPSEDFATICLNLKSGSIEQIISRFEENGRTKEELINSIQRRYPEIKDDYVIGKYTFFTSGKGGAKSRSMELFLVKDDQGKESLYFIG